jgi:hypothetical protein
MKIYGGVEVWLHYCWPRHWIVSFTTRRFSPPGRTPSTGRLGGWVGPETGLAPVGNRTLFLRPSSTKYVVIPIELIRRCQYLDQLASNGCKADESKWIWKDVLLEYSRKYSVKWNEGVRKTRKSLSQDIRSLCRDSKRIFPAYESRELPACQTA